MRQRGSLGELVALLVVGLVALELLAGILSHLLLPLVVLAVLVILLRLVFFHTRKW